MSMSDQSTNAGSQDTTQTISDGGLTGQESFTNSRSTKPIGKDLFRQALEAKISPAPEPEPETEPESNDGPEQHDDSVVAPDHTGGGADPVSEVTPASLAEMAGLTETELYDTLKIKTGDGQVVTLAEAKQQLQDISEAKQGIAEREEKASQLQAQYVSDVQHMGILDAMRAIPDDIRQQASNYMMEQAEAQAADFRRLVPEYQDENRWNKFTRDVDAYLKPYGLSSLHFGVRSIGMYRLMVDMLRDGRDAKEYRKPKAKPAPKPPKASKPADRAKGSTVNVSGNARQRFAQVARHLKG